MKKLLWIVCALMFFNGVSAQQKSPIDELLNKHTLFMGIPMGGDMGEFVDRLETEKKFKVILQREDACAMEGRFTGVQCDLIILVNSDHTVGRVVVMFGKEKNWPPLESRYFGLKSSLTRKYGDPIGSDEKFVGTPHSESAKFYALLRDECKYKAEFSIENTLGFVNLSIQGNADDTSASVRLTYLDVSYCKEQLRSELEDL